MHHTWVAVAAEIPAAAARLQPACHLHLALCPAGHLKKFSQDVQELGNKLLQAALALHEKVVSTFRKTAVNFHYE